MTNRPLLLFVAVALLAAAWYHREYWPWYVGLFVASIVKVPFPPPLLRVG